MLEKRNPRSRVDLLFSLNVSKNQLTLVGCLIFLKIMKQSRKPGILMLVARKKKAHDIL